MPVCGKGVTLKIMEYAKQRNHLETGENNELLIAGCSAPALAAEFGTPLYVMNEELIRTRCREFVAAMKEYAPGGRVMYASKAFMNKAICKIVVSEGLGIDVVSGGELYTALQAGVPAHLIEMHGNNKTPEELTMALEAGIDRIIIDNAHEIDLLEDLASRLGKNDVAVSLRLRPGIDAHTHSAIQTASLDCKFGLGLYDGQALKAAKRILTSRRLALKGIHCHIGSQIFDVSPFSVLIGHFLQFATALRTDTGYILSEFNCGGGYGAWYKPGDAPLKGDEYIREMATALKAACLNADYPLPAITIEPGRSIVGEAGTTLYTVGGVKRSEGIRTYVSVDGGMFENPRCALYDARYTALAAEKMHAPHTEVVAIAGKCCESGDMITWEATLPEVKPGDIIAVLTTGAYNYSMASNYNRNTVPAVVLANKGKAEVIVKRQTYQQLCQNDVLPARLNEA